MQALLDLNHIDEAVNIGDGLFNHVLGLGSAKEFLDLIGPCFNMDVTKPAGTKVGLLDTYDIWAMIIDPFSVSGAIESRLPGPSLLMWMP